ncbi:MAG: hypothetical protein RLZZ156_2211 [Deinococcota bacterium]|jgi:hypothetical protein
MANLWKLKQARANLSELVKKAIQSETLLVTRHSVVLFQPMMCNVAYISFESVGLTSNSIKCVQKPPLTLSNPKICGTQQML